MAFLAPAADITLQAAPNETGRDRSLCWLAARMGESMDGLKDAPGPIRRDDRSIFSSGDIAEDGKILKKGHLLNGARQSKSDRRPFLQSSLDQWPGCGSRS